MPSAKHRVVSFLTRSPEGSASSNQFKPNKQNCGRFQLVIPCPNFPWFQTWPPCLGKVWKALSWSRPGFSEALLLISQSHRFPGHECFGSQRLNETSPALQVSKESMWWLRKGDPDKLKGEPETDYFENSLLIFFQQTNGTKTCETTG